ncbi:hypothetical protein R5R35_009005 [Gryllus longicercus]|uniref:Odorant binding protein n=1 Tax=Gryllus longicercus TaxID=2509291 RepID=A0AAN9VCZ3_9ORTH
MRTRVAIVSGVAAFVVLLLCVASTVGEEEGECNERCQQFKKKFLEFKKDVEECRRQTNYNRQKGSPWPKKDCNATVDEGHVKAMVCWNRLRGLLNRDYTVNVTWWNDHTQNKVDKCIAYRQMVTAGDIDENRHFERSCNRTSTIRHALEKCLREGQAAEQADEGVSAMRAMLRCYCLTNAEFWKNRSRAWGKGQGKGKGKDDGGDSNDAPER